jgi:hypothetical protein
VASSELFLFVSHVAENRVCAMEIVDELERRGTRCWIAPRDIRPGNPFDDEIADAIEASRAMLLIFSDLCNESEYIRREVTVAGESHKTVIPFRIEDAQPRRGLRVRLSDLHWIDGFVSRERAIDEVIKTVRPPAERPHAQADPTAAETADQAPHTIAATSDAAVSLHAKAQAEPATVNTQDNSLRNDGFSSRSKEGSAAIPRVLSLTKSGYLQVASALLLFQGILRAGAAVVFLSAPQGAFHDSFGYEFNTDVSKEWLAVAALTIGIALGIAWQRKWARIFGVIICGIGTLHDLVYAIVGLSGDSQTHIFSRPMVGIVAVVCLTGYILTAVFIYLWYRALPPTA